MVITHPTNETYLYVGLEFDTVSDVKDCWNQIQATGFDFISIPLANERRGCRQDDQNNGFSKDLLFEPSVSSDLELAGNIWSTAVLGKVHYYPSSTAEAIPAIEAYVRQQLDWAQHLNLRTSFVAVDVCWSEEQHIFVANMIASALISFPRQSICIRICIDGTWTDSQQNHHNYYKKVGGGRVMHHWDIWNLYRQCCDYHPCLSVALECLDCARPSPSQLFFQQWLSEPVRYLILDTKIFLKNRQGFPVLSKSFQSMLSRFLPFSVSILVRGEARHPNGYASYLQYLGYLYSKQPTMEDSYRVEMPYFDYLQAPLQPLADHLDSQTYETFEKDPVKYRLYEEALIHCFQDRVRNDNVVVVMVLGAGRGPLVHAGIRASEQVGVKNIRIYAIEKNPHAVRTLKSIQRSDSRWQQIVEVMEEDMRYWNAPEKADVIVSELLGSFGDNELSPECLDAARGLLRPDGICIPRQYTSFLCPLSSPKLFQEIRGYKNPNIPSAFEIPYVVRIHHGQYLADPLPCFHFEHLPVVDTSSHSEDPPSSSHYRHFRYRRLSFQVHGPIMLHGFAGFFEALLYDDIKMSTNPQTLSHGMFSWFPLLFPLSHPICCNDSECRVTFHIWRKVVPGKRIWYEWMLTEPVTTPLHNANGHCYSMSSSTSTFS